MKINHEKTAKDFAVDRERQRLKHQINLLSEEKRQLVIELQTQQRIAENLKRIIEDLTEKNEILQNMTGLPKENIDRFLKEVHEKAEREKKTQSAVEAIIALYHGLY